MQDIVGDYKATLQDCKKLIDENPEFRMKRGAGPNIQWNLVIQPKVDHLQKRLSAHSAKILVLLKPLELNLLSNVYHELSNVHQGLSNQIQDVHQDLRRLIKGLVIGDVAQAISEQEQDLEISIEIPEEIERKFLAVAEKSHPEVRRPDRFPLQAASDAFLAHFEQSTKNFEAGRFLTDRTPSAEQYLNLLKCIWILQRIQSSQEFARVSQSSSESQWPGYIKQLHENVFLECQRFSARYARSAQKLLAPDMQIAFEESKYEIWIEDDLTTFLSPKIENHLPPVLEIPLPRQRENLRRHLSIHPVNETRYKFFETIQDINSPAKQPPSLEMDIDLERFSFIPIYAIPSSRPKAFEVILGSGSRQITPEFQKIKHIYRLQHLLTGYEIFGGYDQEMVKVTFVISGENTQIVGNGRVQLWLHQPFTKPTPENSPAENSRQTLESTIGEGIEHLPSHRGLHTVTQLPRLAQDARAQRNSHLQLPVTNASHGSTPGPLSSSRAPGGLSPTNRRSGTPSTSPFSSALLPNSSALRSPTLSSVRSSATHVSSSSAMSRNTVTTVTTISTGDSSNARLHSMPRKPILVIFFKSRDHPAKLSIIAIQIDSTTGVQRERCKCLSSNSDCQTSCLERGDGYLLAQKWDAGNGSLSNFDIAKLGIEQRKDCENLWERLRRVSLEFETIER